MKMAELLENLRNTYHKHFPRSQCSIGYSDNIYGNIHIRCYLAGNTHELINGYWDNDMFNIQFSIDKGGKSLDRGTAMMPTLPANLQMVSESKSYLINTSKNAYAFEYRRLQFRKTTGDSEKIIKTFDIFLTRLKKQLIDDLHNGLISDKYTGLLRQKLF